MEVQAENQENVDNANKEEDHVSDVAETESQVRGEVDVPKLKNISQQEKQNKQDHGKDADMEANIDQIGRYGDLSPRQIGQLKSRNSKSLQKHCCQVLN